MLKLQNIVKRAFLPTAKSGGFQRIQDLGLTR